MTWWYWIPIGIASVWSWRITFRAHYETVKNVDSAIDTETMIMLCIVTTMSFWAWGPMMLVRSIFRYLTKNDVDWDYVARRLGGESRAARARRFRRCAERNAQIERDIGIGED